MESKILLYIKCCNNKVYEEFMENKVYGEFMEFIKNR